MSLPLLALLLASASQGRATDLPSLDGLEGLGSELGAASGPELQAKLDRFWDRKQARGAVPAPQPAAAGAQRAGAAPSAAPADSKPSVPEPGPTRAAILVGNNWEGTADLVDARTFERIKRIDVVPDKAERLAEISKSPARSAYFLLIRKLIGEGHDQLVDDLFASPDGRTLYVSRPSFADAVAIDVASGRVLWRTPVEGHRADHAALSPDGKTFLVSASTAKKVHAIDTATGRIVGEFDSGEGPHENNYSADGSLIFHASIGRVFIPTTSKRLDWLKGDRYFQVVDAKTLKVLKRVDMGQKLKEFGLPWTSAVRPMALAPDGRYVYLQLSFMHGFVEYDLEQDRVSRVAKLPVTKEGEDRFVLNSAHHGITMSGDGAKLCVAGTVSGYAAIVDRASFAHKIIPLGERPYWATTSADGKFCYVSVAGSNRIAVISFDEEREVASIPVGDHPQRVRVGEVRAE